MAGLAEQAATAAPAPEGEPGADTFTKPDITSAIPPEQVDAVNRIVAAGMKLMYSAGMRDELKAAVNSPEPTAKVLAENVTGLMLMMDQKSGKSGLPPEAIMPAAVELLGDSGDMMVKAGRPVSQEDFKTAMQMLLVMVSKKMGMDDAQVMDMANKALPPEQQAGGGLPPDGPAADAAPPVDPAAAPPVDPAAMPPAAVPPEQPV